MLNLNGGKRRYASKYNVNKKLNSWSGGRRDGTFD